MKLETALSNYLRGIAYCGYLFSPFGIRSAKNRTLIATLPKWMGYQAVEPELPRVAIKKIVEDVPVHLLEPDEAVGNVSLLELIVIVNLVASRRPKRIFEIGTFDGRTTLNMAANAPDAMVYTLDLPSAQLRDTKFDLAHGDKKLIDKRSSGLRFVGTAAASRIVQLYGDSATYDYRDHVGRTDFVFVDGAHSYDYVVSDSEHAFQMINTPGLVLWHDYTNLPGVTRALNGLSKAGRPIKWIEGTTLAFASP